ncbi:hypothetical protein EYF80_032925 [Liparis tanakae]|uniref:Uncharacterized protein n=1 Tax=Liparis tanakae TaxID=230148 RepID=A0A4Z2GTT1_9TELE|nr:hypothetical protein EYF80_032925 [Liparis tanakae]
MCEEEEEAHVDPSCQRGGAGEEAEHPGGVGLLQQPALLRGEPTVVVGQAVGHRAAQHGAQGAAPTGPQLLEEQRTLLLTQPQELPEEEEEEEHALGAGLSLIVLLHHEVQLQAQARQATHLQKKHTFCLLVQEELKTNSRTTVLDSSGTFSCTSDMYGRMNRQSFLLHSSSRRTRISATRVFPPLVGRDSFTLVGSPKKGPRSGPPGLTASRARRATPISSETTASFSAALRETLEGAAALQSIVLFIWSATLLLGLLVPSSVLLSGSLRGVEVFPPPRGRSLSAASSISSLSCCWLAGKSSKGSSSRRSRMESVRTSSGVCLRLRAVKSVWAACSASSSPASRELSSRRLS